MRRAPAAIATGRRPLLVGVVVLVLVAGGVVAFRETRRPEPVDQAVAVLQSESGFDSSKEAVASFALAYQHLADATEHYPKDCVVAADRGRCLALNQAASWTLAFSPLAGGCTQPAIQTGRIAILDYVRRSTALGASVAEPPELPPIPSC